MSDKLTRALTWLSWGAALVPVQPKSKFLVAGYGARSKHITTEAEAVHWFKDRQANLGLVLDGFVCADFDDYDLYFRWALNAGAALATYAESTARGAHVIYKACDEFRDQTWSGLEFKTRGVVMVAPSVNADGVLYRILCDRKPEDLGSLRACCLFPSLRKETAPPSHSPLSTARPLANTPAHSLIGKIKSQLRIDDVVRRAGVELHRSGPGEMVGLCPFDHGGHKDSHPSLWVNVDRQLWGCYAQSCASNRIRASAHDVINFVALSRRISVGQAIAQLSTEIGR